MKRMKKVLSIVLSLAMILTSITVYNTKTAKAAGLFPFKYGQIDYSWSQSNKCCIFMG